jgi:hypothetical protein
MLAAGQGLYFLVTGVWPIVHMHNFEAVTGPKTNDWLVKTVGVLVAAVGATLCSGAASRMISDEIALLAVTSAAGLAAIDVLYSTRGTISGLYLFAGRRGGCAPYMRTAPGVPVCRRRYGLCRRRSPRLDGLHD